MWETKKVKPKIKRLSEKEYREMMQGKLRNLGRLNDSEYEQLQEKYPPKEYKSKRK